MRLDPRRPYKPLDVGNGIVSGSLTPSGRWLGLGRPHPRHGRVVVTDAPRFPDALIGDQGAARRYRAALAGPERAGFGLADLAVPATALVLEDAFPVARHGRHDALTDVRTVAPAGRQGAVQLLRLRAKRDLRYRPAWSGTMRLARAAYTQLTPGGRLPPVSESPVTGGDEGLWWIEDAALGAAVAVWLPPAVDLAAGDERTLLVAIALGADRAEAIAAVEALVRDGHRRAESTIEERRALWTGLGLARPRARPIRRAVSYAIDCAASWLSSDALAMLADHEILPLVWTRDAYYVCRALLAVDPQGLGRTLTRAFLHWCFEVADRPDGWWPRASLASGQIKDPAFQLDQQIYPLLLLDDLARLASDDGPARRFATARDRVVTRLLERRSPFGLVATDETPADDPLDRPFHFSSHVLLWRALRDRYARSAEELRDAVLAHFPVDDGFAYAVRGPRGDGALAYHDANDLPTVFAPGWGFCAATDARWRATIDRAWSPANPGYIPGILGGLGSVHTLHPWPLGDLQDLVAGRVLRDRARVARARARLARVATWDGMLPEAYDETTGAVASRHWFAWPVALWALLEREPALVAP